MRACDNPFRSECVEALTYRGTGFSWSVLLERLAVGHGLGAIRGANGSGKTTLLGELGVRLSAEGYCVRRLRPDLESRALAREQVRRFAVDCGPDTALLLDGADRVGPLEWLALRRTARPAGVLVMTTHREGRLPTLHRCATSPELLADLIGDLVPPGLLTEDVDALFSRQQGNVRTALRELYDRAAAG